MNQIVDNCKILIIFGTRPECIKLAPLFYELKNDKFFDVDILETGQHKDLLLSTKKRLNLDSSDEIIDLIQKYSSISDEKLQGYKELGKQVRESYFEPVTKKSVYRFLGFELS
jgi:UDP-N-acetylglucosamine 2-epimerase (non-hydrolysing)